MPTDLPAALDGGCTLHQVLSFYESGAGAVFPTNIQEDTLKLRFFLLCPIICEKVKLYVPFLEFVSSDTQSPDQKPMINLHVEGCQKGFLDLSGAGRMDSQPDRPDDMSRV